MNPNTKQSHDDDEDELKKKREEYSTEIRRQTREDFFKKKRNLLENIKENQTESSNTSNVHNTLNEANMSEDSEKLKGLVDECLKKTYTMEDFPFLVDAILSKDVQKQHLGVIGLRKILSIEEGPPIQPVIDANLVPRLIEFMQKEELPHLQLESAWALTNVASGTTQQTQTIIDKGGITLFVKILYSKHPEVAEQAIWALGNIAGDSSEFRDMILNCGGIKPLMKILQTTENKNTIKHGTWALSNLCRGKPLPDFEQVKEAIPVLASVVIKEDDPEVLTDATWALSYLSDGSDSRIQSVIDTSCVPRLVHLLNSNILSIVIPSLRTLGNLITGSDQQTNEVLKAGALDKFFGLLGHEKRAVRREACWTLSNITAGDEEQISLVVSNPAYIEKLISLINADSPEIKREAAWVISNATNRGSHQDILKLVEYGVLDVFCQLLYCDDIKTLAVVLEGIKNILSCGEKYYSQGGENIFLNKLEKLNGVTKLEQLQFHSNEEIYEKALYILETNFELEEPI